MSVFSSSALPAATVVRLPSSRNRLSHTTAAVCALAASLSLHATDVTVQPSAGSGFVVKDATGTNERLRVQESGAINLPAVPAAPAQSQGLCISTSGQLGPCSGGTGASYTAATGLALTGTTFSVAPTYRLPQGCAANEVAQWNGTAWSCGASGALPVGAANQTLRYDASNALVANSLFQAFADGGLLASSASGSSSIPVEGPGTRLMWYPGKGAIRAGYVDGTQWDDVKIGFHSAAFGGYTTASGFASTATGFDSVASGERSTAMGWGSIASGIASTAMGGATASGGSSTAMGDGATASGTASTAMGYLTTASGEVSTAMGYSTTADGNHSTAMGSSVHTVGHTGSFIYGDAAHSGVVGNTADNQFLALAYGGVQFWTGEDPVTHVLMQGAELKPGSSSWTVLSDRNAKTAIQPVDGREVLKKVAGLPLNTWQYKTQDAKYRHMGPMAQDFYAAFQLGESDKGIDTVDADGVALAAIQGLHTLVVEFKSLFMEKSAATSVRLDEKDHEIATLRAELQAQKKEIAAQKARLAELKSLAGDLAEMKAQLADLRKLPTSATTVTLRHP